MKKELIFSLMVMLLTGCSGEMGSLYRSMSYDDTVPETPEIIQLNQVDNILIQWDENPWADEYILYRALSPAGLYSEVYKGTQTSYTDTDVVNSVPPDATYYYYRLIECFNDYTTDFSEYGYGVSSQPLTDEFENNNTIGTATVFETEKLIANLYYFQDSDGSNAINIIKDVDWYSIEIKANSLITLDINATDITIPPEYVNIKGAVTGLYPQIIEGDFLIYNYFNYSRVMYFYIMLNEHLYYSNPMTSGGFSCNYEIQFLTEEPID